jgi:hypothetical protein
MALDPELVEQISAAMYGYAGASAAATTLTPFKRADAEHQPGRPRHPGRRGRFGGNRHPERPVAAAPPDAKHAAITRVGRGVTGDAEHVEKPLGHELPVGTEDGKPTRRGGEMSQSPTTSAATPDVIQDAEPTLVKDGTSDAPVFITEQQVVFSTAAARSSRPASIFRRLIDAIRVVGAALYRPPAQRHYLSRSSYLEQSRMAREMDRL